MILCVLLLLLSPSNSIFSMRALSSSSIEISRVVFRNAFAKIIHEKQMAISSSPAPILTILLPRGWMRNRVWGGRVPTEWWLGRLRLAQPLTCCRLHYAQDSERAVWCVLHGVERLLKPSTTDGFVTIEVLDSIGKQERAAKTLVLKRQYRWTFWDYWNLSCVQ